MAYMQPIRGIMDPIPINQFKGVYNSGESPFSIPDGYSQDSRNISTLNFPAISTRPGFSLLGLSLGGRVTGLNQWQGQELHAISNGVWNKLVSTTWTPISGGTGIDLSADCSFANFKGNLSAVNLIMANGIGNAKRYDGSIVQTLSGSPSGGNYIEQHDNRLYLAVANTVYFSALSKADDWTTNKDAGQIIVETNNGQQIIGLRAGNQHLTVFKKSSIHELFGTGPSNYRLIEVANDIGAYSNKAIVNVSGMMYFISNRIYQYSGGSRPDYTFSKPVQSYIDGINPTATSKCVAGTNGKNPYFAIPYGTATECNMILEYDTTNGAWYVWDNLAPVQTVNLNANWYVGDTSGKVFQMGSSNSDNGTAISWKWASPPITGGNIAQRITWYKTWVVFNMPAGSTLNMYLSKTEKGDSDWELIKSFASQTAIQGGKIVMPLSKYANAMFLRVKFEGTGPITIYEFDRQMRKMPLK